MFVNKNFRNTGTYYSKSKRCYNAKLLAYYFYMKTKILLDFHIWIIVSLKSNSFQTLVALSKCFLSYCIKDDTASPSQRKKILN